MNSFTRAVLEHALSDSTIKKMCLEYREQETDRVKLLVVLADVLEKSFSLLYGQTGAAWMGSDGPLLRTLVQAAVNRVDWETVAGEILERYAPKLLAGYVNTPSIN
jgi:hypothetical protein